jgi:hypothetical protein
MSGLEVFAGALTGFALNRLEGWWRKLLAKSKFRRLFEATLDEPFKILKAEYPDIADQICAEPFLAIKDVQDQFGVLFTTRLENPSSTKLIKIYRNEYGEGHSEEYLTHAFIRFVELLDYAMKNVPEFNEILSHRQIEQIYTAINQLTPSIHDFRQPGTPSASVMVVKPALTDEDRTALVQALGSRASELLNWNQTLPDGKWIEREELGELEKWLDRTKWETPQKKPLFLLGSPGSGKSALLARLGNELQEQGCSLLALKADGVPKAVTDIAALENHLGLPQPLKACIERLAEDGPVVVLLDQLDALCDLVTSDPGVLGVMTDVIRALTGLPGVRVVCSCRDFEYHHDVRFSRFEADTVELKPLTWEVVSELLVDAKVSTAGWTEEFRDTLCLPQHLSVFLKYLKPEDGAAVYKGYREMLSAVWTKHVVGDPDLKCDEAACAIASYMADKETLWAPVALFEGDYTAELKHLESVEIIVRDGETRIGFRHQTMFDFARARAFLKGETKLAAFVLDKQESLFIRPIVLSALDFLRELEPKTYQEELKALWDDGNLRFHLRTLLIDLLGRQPNPDHVEKECMRAGYADPNLRRRVLAAPTKGSGWFDVFQHEGLPEVMALPVDEAQEALPLLHVSYPSDPDNVLRLVKAHWSDREEMDFDVFWMIAKQAPADHLPSLQHLIELVQRRSFRRTMFVEALGKFVGTFPQESGELLQQLLDFRLKNVEEPEAEEPAVAEGEQAPNAPDAEFLQYANRGRPWKELFEDGDWYHLDRVTPKAPEIFAPIMMQWTADVLSKTLHEDIPRFHSYKGDKCTITSERGREGRQSHNFMTALIAAVEALASTSPDVFLSLAKAWEASDLMTVHRLLARGFEVIVAEYPGAVLDYLLGDSRRFAIGDFSMRMRWGQRLVTALAPHLDPEQIARLEEGISGWELYREYEDDDDEARQNVYERNAQKRLVLLNCIGKDALSDDAQSKLDEAEKAGIPLKEREAMVVTEWKSSPPSVEDLVSMQDEELLASIREHYTQKQDGKQGVDGWDDWALVSSFEEFAKQYSRRALSIMSEIKSAEHEPLAASCLCGVAESGEIAPEEVHDLFCGFVKQGCGSDNFRSRVTYALTKVARAGKGLPDDICSILEEWLVPPENLEDPILEDEDREYSLLWDNSGFISVPGGNYTVLEAVTDGLLYRDPPAGNAWLDVLERHLEMNESHRCMQHFMLFRLRWLHLADHRRAENYVTGLYNKFPQLKFSLANLFLLSFAQHWMPVDLWRELVVDMRDSQWKRGAQGFGELVGLKHFIDPADEWVKQQVDALVSGDGLEPEVLEQARFGLAWTCAKFWHDSEEGEREPAEKILTDLAAVATGVISRPVLDIFRSKVSLLPTASMKEYLNVCSQDDEIMKDAADSFLTEKLADLLGEAPGTVADVTDAIIRNLPEYPIPHDATRHPRTDDLTRIGLGLNRVTGFEERGLLIFERMLEIGEYQTQEILKEMDRYPKQ